MPVITSYPGVYIEEIPSGVRTITGVSTSTTAFIGSALRGPVNDPIIIHSYADYERAFGGLWDLSSMSYSVQQYFQNGGTDAVIVRLMSEGASKAQFSLPPEGGTTNIILEARNEGSWGNNLQISVDYETRDRDSKELFNIIIEETYPSGAGSNTTKKVRSKEVFLNVTIQVSDTRNLGKVLSQESELVQLQDPQPGDKPMVRPAKTLLGDPIVPNIPGSDGDDSDLPYIGSQDEKTGIYALEKTDIFNLLCIPPCKRDGEVGVDVWNKAQDYCRKRRAFLIIDPPNSWKKKSDAVSGADGLRGGYPDHSALFFPRVRMADPLKENRLEEFVPCGVVAGIFARTDAKRGIWKAPAGIDTPMAGVQELTVKLTNEENGDLNPLGINCLRNFPIYSNIIWGARTLAGADKMASEWKYIPIRRLALYIEESLYRGTQWVVFEPNDEPLWAQIRLNVGSFMHDLFRQGAFQGTSPREAYFVKCDKETTNSTDVNNGVVNVIVGFAPLKPAEFVVIKLQQMAGQIEI